MSASIVQPLPDLLAGLRAAGEETRLRVLALLSEGELSVSDLTDILGQSQPRISRHLKLMAEAGLIERHREGAWAYYRIAAHTPGGALARELAARLDQSDPMVVASRERLAAVRAQRAQAAQVFFARMARDWDRVRTLHAPDAAVEAAISETLGPGPFDALLDLGTGTGRMLQLFADRARRAVGVDASHAMLAVARANLERAGLTNIDLRQGDLHALPFGRNAFDVVLTHQVLHFLDDPARAIREVAGALSPGGRLIIVDFATHGLEFLRTEHGHRRLGFSREQMTQWFTEARLTAPLMREVAPQGSTGGMLTVTLWAGRDQRPTPPSTGADRRAMQLETV